MGYLLCNVFVSLFGRIMEQKNIHTDKELAKMAGVGTGTVARYDTE